MFYNKMKYKVNQYFKSIQLRTLEVVVCAWPIVYSDSQDISTFLLVTFFALSLVVPTKPFN